MLTMSLCVPVSAVMNHPGEDSDVPYISDNSQIGDGL